MKKQITKRAYLFADDKKIQGKEKKKIESFVNDIMKICKKHQLIIVEFDEIENEALIDSYEEIHLSWFNKVRVWWTQKVSNKNKNNARK